MLVLNRARYIGHYIALSIVPSWGEYLLSLLGPEVYIEVFIYIMYSHIKYTKTQPGLHKPEQTYEHVCEMT